MNPNIMFEGLILLRAPLCVHPVCSMGAPLWSKSRFCTGDTTGGGGGLGMGETWNGKIWHNKSVPHFAMELKNWCQIFTAPKFNPHPPPVARPCATPPPPPVAPWAASLEYGRGTCPLINGRRWCTERGDRWPYGGLTDSIIALYIFANSFPSWVLVFNTTPYQGCPSETRFFFLLRTALKDSSQGPPIANRQPPPTTADRHHPSAANCQLPTFP